MDLRGRHNDDQKPTGSATAGDASRLIFGIYPGGAAGSDSGLATGPPGDPARIQAALFQLQGDGRPFLVRGYIHYTGSTGAGEDPHPANVEQYAVDGRKSDLVLCYRDHSDDLQGWLGFVREAVRRYGPRLATLQVTEEANLKLPGDVIDGCFANVRQALVEGVMAAKAEVIRQGYDLQVGFSAVPSFDPEDDFWPSIGSMGGRAFVAALDYVGLDFYPDVFWPVAPDGSTGDLRDAVMGALRHFREINLPAANIPASVPIHVAENGWPTGPERAYERQARVIETTIRTINDHRVESNITHYELFALRDADSASPGLFHQFGIMRDDYTPKPAFETYRRLIAELGARAWR